MVLPFNFKPTLSTYLYLAYPFGILENPRVPSPMLNWNIQLMVQPGVSGRYAHFLSFYPAINAKGYSSLGLLNWKNLLQGRARNTLVKDLIAETAACLGQNNYVLVYADYFYIPGTDHYSKAHFRHDLLIYGCNRAEALLKGALYKQGGVFGPVDVPYEKFLAAFTSPHARGSECAKYCRGDLWVSLSPRADGADLSELDPAAIQSQIESYLKSSFTFQYQTKNRPVQAISFGAEAELRQARFGLDIYAEITRYFLQFISKGRCNYDIRITRLLAEHKKLMRLRLERLEEAGWTGLGRALKQWGEVEHLAKSIHLRVVAARARADARLLCRIDDDLKKLRTLETGVLLSLVD